MSQSISLALAPSSDSGSVGDGITNNASPTFNGIADPGASVTVQVTGALGVGGGVALADNGGSWSFPYRGSLADSNYAVNATEQTISGPVVSPDFHLTIDTVAPAPSTLVLAAASDSGAKGDSVTNIATPTITGRAEIGDTVALYDGGIQIGTGTADSTGAWSITAGTPLNEGPNTLTAVATDTAGNSSAASKPLTVTLDTVAAVAPSALFLAPESDSGTKGDSITNVTKPAITGTATAGDTITLYSGNTPLGITQADSSGTWSITTGKALAEGVNSLTALATDPAGNQSSLSTEFSVTLDTSLPTSPSMPVLAPTSDSGVKGDNITSNDTPTLTGTAAAGEAISLYDGKTLIGSGTADSITGAWSITVDHTLDEGVNSLTAVATNDRGNSSAPSTPLSVTLDTTAAAIPSAPELTASSDTGVKGDNITSNDQPTLTGTATKGDTVTLYHGGTAIGTGTADGTTGLWSITADTSLDEGPNSLTAKATDAAGNQSGPSDSLTVTLDTTAPNAPSVPVLAGASDTGVKNDNVTSNDKPTLTGTAGAGDTVTLSIGNTVIGTGTADGSGAWSITTDTSLSEGNNDIVAKAADPAGNQSGKSDPLSVTLDTTAPGAPSTLTLAPADETGAPGDNMTGNNLPTITGTAEAGDSIALYDGGTQIGTGTADQSGAWSITAGTALTEGANSLTATATDPAGNASTASSPLSVTLNTAPKDFAYTVPATGETGVASGSAYSGPVSYIQEQYLYSGTNGVSIATATPNVFLHGGPGDDALTVSSGSNVVDGGAGSNFLTGAMGADGGTDTFFDDGRSGQTVWDTIVNFHTGDAAVIFGFNKDVSTLTWADNEGAAGFQGTTLHSELGGAGTGVNASFTFAGMTAADAQANFAISNGTTADGTPYLYVQHT